MMAMSCLHVLVLVCMAVFATSFVGPSRGPTAKTFLAMYSADVPVTTTAAASTSNYRVTSSMNDGIGRYLAIDTDSSSSITSSTSVLSLKDRPPPPTPEEIAEKKRTFNLWFWGGGFVAPFLATFYYFGLRFWES
mmetsp:Transcript_27413/g.62492  ORF Transcript_27413/g.62492 Transcript_27413/m.62492 type:complete len:135 (-) Transcript_27413:22-426(-)